MLNFFDKFLDRITMYRLALYVLSGLIFGAAVLGVLGFLSVSPSAIIISALFLTVVCWLTNTIFARTFMVPTNVESVYITAFILALIITPPTAATYAAYLVFATWAGVLAMASKYILAIKRKHVFNPAAIAVALTAIFLNHSASWWVGTAAMAPLTAIACVLIVRKIRRADLAVNFLFVAIAVIVGGEIFRGVSIVPAITRVILDSPILFFAGVMLTEPLTSPPTENLRIVYGGLVGVLFAPFIHIGGVYSTPELALLVGNLFVYLVSPKQKYMLKFKEKIQLTDSAYDFIFSSDAPVKFISGQYLEWTLGYEKPDSRGNRRYFTVASAPEEEFVRIGIKFNEPSSSFKSNLLSMKPGHPIVASQLAGDFVLPKNPKTKLVFIAGGIGITPFRSMIQHLIVANQRRDIVLLYSNKSAKDVAYKDVFDKAGEVIGLRTIYRATEESGYIDAAMIKREVPDYVERMFYISGPHSMVISFKSTLKELGVNSNRIVTDYFPGFA